jgi:hypothetical protein
MNGGSNFYRLRAMAHGVMINWPLKKPSVKKIKNIAPKY